MRYKSILIPRFLTVVSIIALLSVGVSSTVASFNSTGKAAITAKSGEINLGLNSASKKSYTFDLGNQWYPGKSDTKSLTVYNSGNLDMKYSVKSSLLSESLVDQIDVTAKINGAVVYQGKMNSIAIPQRTLEKNASEVIEFSLAWPYLEANMLTDYALKGKTASNTLVFTATN